MLQEFSLAFLVPDIDKTLFVVKTVLITVCEQVFNEEAFVYHNSFFTIVLLAWAVGITTRSAMLT